MRILILAPNYRNRVNWGHQLWRDEIARQNDVVFHGQGHALNKVSNVKELVRDHGPFDVITVGENSRHFHHYTGLAECPQVKVCFCGDYYGAKAVNYDKLIRKHGIDIVILSSPDFFDDWQSRQQDGVEGHCLPYIYSVDVNRYQDFGEKRDVDVMCVYGLFNAVYPKRPELQNIIGQMPYKTVIGNWKVGNWKRDNYVRLLNRSKIFVSVNGVYNQMTMKYTEAMACGTLFLTDKPKHLDYWGIKDGEHLVCYTNFEDMRAKVEYYLSHDDEREFITHNAYKLVHSKFTMERWVRIWSQIVQEKVSWNLRKSYNPGL
jgi:glycosyltransferase involved in cell wall biosynthesis